jgi:alkylated DNA repair dioxygenase AlkB
LESLSKRLLKRIPGFEAVDYRPEAAIVNFYTMDATIGGHTDHSEPNKTAPLGAPGF